MSGLNFGLISVGPPENVRFRPMSSSQVSFQFRVNNVNTFLTLKTYQ